jgi:hypothetical protein
MREACQAKASAKVPCVRQSGAKKGQSDKKQAPDIVPQPLARLL